MARTVVVGAPGVLAKVEDVVQVAKGGDVSWMHASGEQSWAAVSELPAARVVLHPSALQKIQLQSADVQRRLQMLSPFQHSAPEGAPRGRPGSDQPVLSGTQSRAVLFVRLLTVINGQPRVRGEVIHKLVAMLNADRIIQIVAAERDETVLADIVRLIESDEFGPAVRVAPNERAVLLSGQIPTVGLGAVTVVAAKRLQKAALAVAALSCEALHAKTVCLKQETVTKIWPPNAIRICVALDELLAESKLVDPGGDFSDVFDGISMLPAVHGELASAIDRCEEAVTAALRMISTHPRQMLRLGPTIGLPLVLLYNSALLERATELSLFRARRVRVKNAQWVDDELDSISRFTSQASVLRSVAQSVVSSDVGRACFSGALAGWAGITALVNALAVEAAISVLSLREQEAQALQTDPAMQRRRKGLSLGIGTGHVRRMLEEAMSNFGNLQQAANLLSELQSTGMATEAKMRIQAMLTTLDPIGDRLPRRLSELRHFLAVHLRQGGRKHPLGTLELTPAEVLSRQRRLGGVVEVFGRHGGVPLDQPSVQKRDRHCHLYNGGPESVFQLASDAPELLSLQYDLTLPLARFAARHDVKAMKCYQIAKVYRHEEPVCLGIGTLCEFWQCDFDILGNSPGMMTDAELLKILVEALDKLDIGEYRIRLNHRDLLHSILQAAGVPAFKHGDLLQSIDAASLRDRRLLQTMQAMLLDQHSVKPQVTEQMMRFTSMRGPPAVVLDTLARLGSGFSGIDGFSTSLADLQRVVSLLDSLGCLSRFELDLSIVGGFDYYTGIVFEVFRGASPDDDAIAAGGRYDDLVSLYGKQNVRAVGFSIGIDRLFQSSPTRASSEMTPGTTEIEVLVMSVGKDLLRERLKLSNELWEKGVATEYSHQRANPSLPEQMSYATSHRIPLAVIMAPRELSKGVVDLMQMRTAQCTTVARLRVVDLITSRLRAMGLPYRTR